MTRLLARRLCIFAAVVATAGGGAGVAGASATPARAGAHAFAMPRIVGGNDAPAGSFPWLAFVESTNGDMASLCTGTVISSNLVLTAGHCAYDVEAGALYPPSSFAVVTGAPDWTDTSTRQVSAVTQTFLAPGYNPATDDHDAAILELSAPVAAPPLALATSADAGLLAAGDGVAIAGWGLTDPQDPNSNPTMLQWAPTVVQRSTYCSSNAASNFPFDASSELCTVDAPYDDTSFCHGDSGGPVIADYLEGEPDTPTEIGVINSSVNCATTGPGYSARVDAIEPWAAGLISTLAPAAAPTSTSTAPSASPAPPLGTLTLAAGRRDVRATLRGVFKTRYRRARALRLSCWRVSKTHVRCDATWSYGPNDFYGNVTAYLTVYKGRVVWSDRYVIRVVNDYCYFNSGHRRSCRITKYHGSF